MSTILTGQNETDQTKDEATAPESEARVELDTDERPFLQPLWVSGHLVSLLFGLCGRDNSHLLLLLLKDCRHGC